MIVSRVDPDSKSSLAGMEGSHALMLGDTLLARQKYGEAGDILLRGSKLDLPAADKHLLRFLAASQYYHGGDYHRAAKITKSVNRGHLPPSDYPCFDQFLKDIAIRTAEGYAKGIRLAVYECRQSGKYEEGLQILQAHPYVYDPAGLAHTRADLCIRSGKIKAAVLFSADANRYSNFHANAVTSRAFQGHHLMRLGKHTEAEEYQQLVLKYEPTALDLAMMGVRTHKRFEHGDRSSGVELLNLMDRAKVKFSELPEMTRNDHYVRDGMSHGFLLASHAATTIQDRDSAAAYLDLAKAFAATQLMISLVQLPRTTFISMPTSIPSESQAISTRQHERSEEIEQLAYRGQFATI